MTDFAQALLAWYRREARTFPWRGVQDPYAVWVSESMLQQTRTDTVLHYYNRFMQAFPTIAVLAAASEDEVLTLWQGLGYYSRARNLHKAARVIAEQFGGRMPDDVEKLKTLPGIGPYMAGAVASIAFGRMAAAVDGNHARVLCRVLHIQEDIARPATRKALERAALSLMPDEAPGAFNQALMDVGATICIPKSPRCSACPLCALCQAFACGDAETLPLKAAKPPQRNVDLVVALVHHGGRYLIIKRKQALLGGLWVFPLLESVSDPFGAQTALEAMGVQTDYTGALGEATHVFTHIKWHMRIWRFEARQSAAVADGEWVKPAEMNTYPFPTAMRAARKALRTMEMVRMEGYHDE